MKNTVLAASLSLVFSLYGCSEQAGSASGGWTAEIHPDADAPEKSHLLGEYPSYDACVAAAMEALGGDGVFNCSIS